MDKRIILTETEERGVCLTVNDYELLDEIDDFFIENYHVCFSGLADNDDGTYTIDFGRTNCIKKIKSILEKFISEIPYPSDQ